MTAKKRGRPAGSRNIKTLRNLKVGESCTFDELNRIIENSPVSEFEKTLNEWDEAEKKVDFKDLCQKLQEALAKSYVEAEELEKQINHWRNETGARDIVIRYLESRK
jgi:hypothetical protein